MALLQVSLTAIMDQKKVVHASTVAMQLASAAEQDRPKRKLAALMRPATGRLGVPTYVYSFACP